MVLLSSICKKDILFIFSANKVAAEEVPQWVKSVQSTLSHLISTSVPRATFTRFLVEHGLLQYYSY